MCVGIRSKMALCSSNITDIVFFRVCTPVFLITVVINGLKSRHPKSLTYLLTSSSTDLSARGVAYVLAPAGKGSQAAFKEIFLKRRPDLGVDGKMHSLRSQRVFPTNCPHNKVFPQKCFGGDAVEEGFEQIHENAIFILGRWRCRGTG